MSAGACCQQEKRRKEEDTPLKVRKEGDMRVCYACTERKEE